MERVCLDVRLLAAREQLAARLDELGGGALLLDPAALRRLRAAVDAAIPLAEDYARQLTAVVDGATA